MLPLVGGFAISSDGYFYVSSAPGSQPKVSDRCINFQVYLFSCDAQIEETPSSVECLFLITGLITSGKMNYLRIPGNP